MKLRRITGLALGLALPLTFVVSAAAQDDESFRDRLVGGIPSYSDFEAAVVGTADEDGAVLAVPSRDELSAVDDTVRAAFSTLYSDVRTAILEGPSDE